MDYTQAKLLFKIKKVLRYVGMYGLSRTWMKVKGQLHMKKHFAQRPLQHKPSENQRVGLIGCGNYAFTTIAYYINKKYSKVIAACMDKDIHKAASLAQNFSVPVCSDKGEDVINEPHVKLVYIASNHASHAEYAIEALKKGKDVYIEKPHVVSLDQLQRLMDCLYQTKGRAYLGFNRPGSRLGEIVLRSMQSQSGAAMINWFVAGHAIDPDHWYFKKEEGGRVLGNLCHWTDFTLRMIPEAFPIKIQPTRAEKSDCDIAVNYTFADGSIAVITFSAKGHTFEGVKEKLNVHKGNVLLSLDDYKSLTVENVDQKTIYRNIYRDHGHEKNITGALVNSLEQQDYNYQKEYEHIWNSAYLFLKTKEALDENITVVVEAFDKSYKRR